jgi:hypothetical protein
LERTEISPNRIVFHGVEEIRQLLGVGTQLKEQKVVDHRPKRAAQEANHVAGPAGSGSGLDPIEPPHFKPANQSKFEVKQ